MTTSSPVLDLRTPAATEKNSGWERVIQHWWIWELIASAISLVAMIDLVAVLSKVDGRTQRSVMVGDAELTLNTIVAAFSTVIPASLAVMVAGALNQSPWNWFSSKRRGSSQFGRPLRDLETFGNAANDSWSSLKLLWETKGT